MDVVCAKIFSYMDMKSLMNAELVSKAWKSAIQEGIT